MELVSQPSKIIRGGFIGHKTMKTIEEASTSVNAPVTKLFSQSTVCDLAIAIIAIPKRTVR